MGARGTGLDFALHYMSQLRDDHAILNTYVHAHIHTQGSWSTGLSGCTDQLAVNTAHLYLLS